MSPLRELTGVSVFLCTNVGYNAYTMEQNLRKKYNRKNPKKDLLSIQKGFTIKTNGKRFPRGGLGKINDLEDEEWILMQFITERMTTTVIH